MNRLRAVLSASSLALLILTSAGCSTINSAYDSTVDTVSGWFGKGSKKAD
jgi:hypothetical protein